MTANNNYGLQVDTLPASSRDIPRQTFIKKRIMDLILGIPCLLVGLPIILLAALLIRVVSRGPAFFVQERVGLDGKSIYIWKLRTMYLDAQERLQAHLESNPEAQAEWHKHFKLRDDPRILPWTGKFMRATSLDELPQIWNVLRGDMSLVGPRPLPKYHLQRCPHRFLELRQSVQPGLTGLWQVQIRSEGDLTDLEAYDTHYITNWSLKTDIALLLKTIPVALLQRRGF